MKSDFYPSCAWAWLRILSWYIRWPSSVGTIVSVFTLCSCGFRWKQGHLSSNPSFLGCLPGMLLPFPISGDGYVLVSTLCKCLDFGKQFAFSQSTLWYPSASAHLLFTAAYPLWVVKRWSLSQLTVDERRRYAPDKSVTFTKWAAIKFCIKNIIYLQMHAISMEAL